MHLLYLEPLRHESVKTGLRFSKWRFYRDIRVSAKSDYIPEAMHSEGHCISISENQRVGDAMLLQTAKILIRKAEVVVMCDDMARASMGNHEKSRQAYALHVWWSKSNEDRRANPFQSMTEATRLISIATEGSWDFREEDL
ncbi:hypothetical protein XPA_005880 [Xanthoria parietina]